MLSVNYLLGIVKDLILIYYEDLYVLNKTTWRIKKMIFLFFAIVQSRISFV